MKKKHYTTPCILDRIDRHLWTLNVRRTVYADEGSSLSIAAWEQHTAAIKQTGKYKTYAKIVK